MKQGDIVEADDGVVGTVTGIYGDGSFDITYDDGVIERTDAEGNTEVIGEVVVDPKEKLRQENIRLGRHPLFVPLMDAPENATSIISSQQQQSRGPSLS